MRIANDLWVSWSQWAMAQRLRSINQMLTRASAVVFLVMVVHSTVAAQSDDESTMLQHINELRAANNLPPLQIHAGLNEAARVHSQDMAEHDELTHVSDRTGDPTARVSAAGVSADHVAQNIARHRTALGAFQQIVASDPHRAQILGARVTHVGLSVVRARGAAYVTQLFARVDDAGSIEPALPPPSVSAPPPAINTRLPEPPAAAAPPPSPTEASPPVVSSPQAPRISVPYGAGRVAGYWVHHGGRWWYFPVPAGAQPGQVLQPDPNVQGPPPGYEQYGQNHYQPSQPQLYREVPRRRYWLPSPRRNPQYYY